MPGQAQDLPSGGFRHLANIDQVPAPCIEGGESRFAGVPKENAVQANVPELHPGLRIQEFAVVGFFPVESPVVSNSPRLFESPPDQIVKFCVVTL